METAEKASKEDGRGKYHRHKCFPILLRRQSQTKFKEDSESRIMSSTKSLAKWASGGVGNFLLTKEPNDVRIQSERSTKSQCKKAHLPK